MIGHKRERAIGTHPKGEQGARGFTLIETTIALLIMMIVMLGAASVFAYATFNNSNGEDRAQTLAVAQEVMEALRSKRFSTAGTDAQLSAGTTTSVMRRGASGPLGRQYQIVTTIADTTPTVKTITISATPIAAGQAWAANTSWATVTLITQRTQSDQP